MSDRTSNNADDYEGTENIERLLDAWGFDVVSAEHKPWPRIVVRPRDSRTHHMRGILEKCLLGMGVLPAHFAIVRYEYLDGESERLILVGVDDYRVMLDRKTTANVSRWATWEHYCGPDIDDPEAIREAMEEVEREAQAD